jgi:hypothetical protein
VGRIPQPLGTGYTYIHIAEVFLHLMVKPAILSLIISPDIGFILCSRKLNQDFLYDHLRFFIIRAETFENNFNLKI